MEGWDKLKKDLELYQERSNSMWITDKPIFCDYTKKQFYHGYIISDGKKILGICESKYFIDVLSYKLFSCHDNIYLRGIESNALPTKKTSKKERSKISLKIRYEVLKRDGFKCKYCGAKAGDIELQIDHIIPVSKGGKSDIDNLQTLCIKCNLGKSNSL